MGTPKNYEINVISTQNEQGRIKESGEEYTGAESQMESIYFADMPKTKPDGDDQDFTPGKSRRRGYHDPSLDLRSEKKQLEHLMKGNWENGEY